MVISDFSALLISFATFRSFISFKYFYISSYSYLMNIQKPRLIKFNKNNLDFIYFN